MVLPSTHILKLFGGSFFHHMDPLTPTGIFVAGVGVGISSLSWRPARSEGGQVTCHCECGARPETVASGSSRELLLSGALGFVLGALVTLWLIHKTVVGVPSGDFLLKGAPVKGRGKHGVFGRSEALPLEL